MIQPSGHQHDLGRLNSGFILAKSRYQTAGYIVEFQGLRLCACAKQTEYLPRKTNTGFRGAQNHAGFGVPTD